MRRFIYIIAACLAASSISACSDKTRDPLSPTRSDMIVPIGPYPKIDPYANNFVEINSGWWHTCARTKAGAMYCWGSDGFGESGGPATVLCGVRQPLGLVACIPQPTRVQNSVFSGGSAISAGGSHTCALSAGAVWCWGSNLWAEVGNGQVGPYASVTTPTKVSGTDVYAAVGAGGTGTCGITTAHMLNCWGAVNGSSTPAMYSISLSWSNNVTLGTSHFCAQNLGGWWGCWGNNDSGQLSADPTVWPSLQGPINNPATNVATRVREGDSFTCADQPNGTILCLGKNDVGQLGTSAFTGTATTVVQTVGGGMQLSHVATGTKHACALDVNGAAYCWGDNTEGKLGIGSSGGFVRDPMPVLGGLTFRDISAGQNHTCAIGTNNGLYCWGANDEGQLGQPSAPLHGQVTPVQAVAPF